MSNRIRGTVSIFLVTVGVAVLGCSASDDRGEFDHPDSAGAGAMASTGAADDLGVGGGGPGVGPAAGCSADLQNVVDASGHVVKECPSDQGCWDAKCILACEAAALSKGTIGCDFWGADPPFLANGHGWELDGPCYAVFLANTWGRPAKLTVTRGAQSFDMTQFGYIPKGIFPNTTYEPLPATGIPPNEVAVLFLSHKPGVMNNTSLECPVPPALLEDGAVSGSGRGAAFHVVSDTPVSAYDILPFGGAASYLPSATLLFPATAWGTNYYAIAPHNPSGSLWAAVIANHDGTTVKVATSITLPGGGGIDPAPAGLTTEYKLDAGEVLQWLDPDSLISQTIVDPTGAIFESDKPIALLTGNTYLQVPSATSPNGGGQDSAHQQIPHVKALGSEYVGAGVVTRLADLSAESVPYRVLGVVDGTELLWDPAPPSGAPVALAAGEVAEFETTEIFSVKSQDADHPFVFTQYLAGTPQNNSRPGCGGEPPIEGIPCALGDEDWVNLVSPRQFLQRYVFFTDPTYSTTNLVLVRTKGPEGFSDVEVGCLGTVTGWEPVGSAGVYQYAHVDLVRETVAVASCDVSRHEATSAGAFGITVWGTDWFSSYGYPAGGNIGVINDVEVPSVPK
jgi:hypothetical protein